MATLLALVTAKCFAITFCYALIISTTFFSIMLQLLILDLVVR